MTGQALLINFYVFAGTIKVISVKLSKSGSPLVVLATRHAFLFDTSLMCWLRVADDCFPASNFSSSWNLGSGPCGELAGLQVDVRKYMARKPGWNRLVLYSCSLVLDQRWYSYSKSIKKLISCLQDN